jgi:hypothetical protein
MNCPRRGLGLGNRDPPRQAHADWARGPRHQASQRARRLSTLSLIPVYIVVWLASLVGYVAAIVVWFSIVVGGRVPGELTELTAKALASITRATAYALLLTDRYPPAWDQDTVTGIRPVETGPPAIATPPPAPTTAV